MKRKKKTESVGESIYRMIDEYNASIRLINSKRKDGVTMEMYILEMGKRLNCCFVVLVGLCSAAGLKKEK